MGHNEKFLVFGHTGVSLVFLTFSLYISPYSCLVRLQLPPGKGGGVVIFVQAYQSIYIVLNFINDSSFRNARKIHLGGFFSFLVYSLSREYFWYLPFVSPFLRAACEVRVRNLPCKLVRIR